MKARKVKRLNHQEWLERKKRAAERDQLKDAIAKGLLPASAANDLKGVSTGGGEVLPLKPF